EDKEYSREQLRRFQGVVEEAKRRGLSPTFLHIANSAALLTFPPSHFNLVRPGISLYGVHPTISFRDSFPHPLRPVMSLKSRVAAIKLHPPSSPISYGRTYHTRKESLIATVPIGYADGYPRRLSNKGKVLVRGRRVQVVGVVTMDWIMVDVSEVPGVRIGDEVVLIGKQGREEISVEEVASWADTIPYEILCGVGKRVPRVYKGAEG
ncbi:MAG: alanine racemase, partial [Deltaproteobacteria bacterium]